MDIENIENMRTSCEQCAACCTGGGPILRLVDEHLVRSGKIPSKYLYTLREGERLYDKDQKKMVPIPTDHIKIKIQTDSLKCIFLGDNNECTIYSVRPSECRAFKCWDKLEIEMKYKEDPLLRSDLLGEVEGLWDLIQDHHEKCSYSKIEKLIYQLTEEKKAEVIDDLNEILLYDKGIRETLAEKAGVDPEMIDFLIGRPLTQTIAMFNMRIVDEDGKKILKPIE